MQIFVSSAKADRRIASDLARHLSAKGHRAVEPSQIFEEGDNWSLMIGKELEKADAMVTIVSPESVSSESFHRNLSFALGREGFENRLISVFIGHPKQFPWILKHLPTVRITKKFELEKAADKIASLLSTASTQGDPSR